MDNESKTITDMLAKATRIIGVLTDPSGSASVRKRRLMRQLTREIQADGWIWVTMTGCEERQPSLVLDVLGGEVDAYQQSGWLKAIQSVEPTLPDANGLAKMMLGGKHQTSRRYDLMSDDVWDTSTIIQDCFTTRGLGDLIYSVYPTSQAAIFSVVGLVRKTERSHFSRSDSELTHVVLANVGWLHASSPAIPLSKNRLTPTQRVVLSHLLEGLRRAEIAVLMGISSQTARDHIRAVLRLYGVRDQLELVCHFHAEGRG